MYLCTVQKYYKLVGCVKVINKFAIKTTSEQNFSKYLKKMLLLYMQSNTKTGTLVATTPAVSFPCRNSSWLIHYNRKVISVFSHSNNFQNFTCKYYWYPRIVNMCWKHVHLIVCRGFVLNCYFSQPFLILFTNSQQPANCTGELLDSPPLDMNLNSLLISSKAIYTHIL